MLLRQTILCCLIATASIAAGQSNPYFPERGPGAVHQRALDVTNPVVVLTVAAEPGQEDLVSLAALRFGAGARVVALYFTNGAATPPDDEAGFMPRVAARRKEEAFRALSLIGGETHYLNLPDFGIVGSPGRLDSLWGRDSVLTKLARVLRSVRPDVILISRDFRPAGTSAVREEFIQRVTSEAAERTSSLQRSGEDGLLPWKVGRIFVESSVEKGGLRIPAELVHPVWKKSVREIAREALARYESLRLQAKEWNQSRTRTYALAGTPGRRLPASVVAGYPELGPVMRPVVPLIKRAADGARKLRRDQALPMIEEAVREVERILGRQQSSLTNGEKRVLASWKNGLESLRCALLNIEISFEASDSLITESQLLFLRFKEFTGDVSLAKTQILFPAAINHLWGINESLDYRFPFKVPSEFRIITPEKLEPNVPGSVHGLDRPMARTKFSFIIFHEDTAMARNFAYRKEVGFNVGPRRAVEILTPVVRVTPGERLVFATQNFSRDGFEGEAVVKDSIVQGGRVRLSLPVKDFVSTDTLRLAWADTIADGDHLIDLRIAGKSAGRFMARKFSAVADTTRVVGLITAITGSPVEDALRRLHVPFVLLTPESLSAGGLERVQSLILDRDALAMRTDLRAHAGRISAWVKEGRSVIALPQADAGETDLTGGMTFDPAHAFPPDAGIELDGSSRLADSPNPLGPGDWQEWIFSRSRGGLQFRPGTAPDVLAREAVTRTPLVATMRFGRGRITAVALDIIPQLQIMHAGGYRVFANLLSF